MAVALLAHALPAFCLHMHHHLPQGVRQHGGARGHQLAGINVKAAGVVPYVRTEDGSVLFLMQEMINGSRAGQLCDFGGRREPGDCDLYWTAARELTEETCGAFGSTKGIAQRLRHERTVRILNPVGKYLAFFLKVTPQQMIEPQQMISAVDHASGDFAARDCRWIAAEELLSEQERVQGRLLVHHAANDGRSTPRGDGPSGFDVAVRKTLSLEIQRTKNRRGRSFEAPSLDGGAPLSVQAKHQPPSFAASAGRQQRAGRSWASGGGGAASKLLGGRRPRSYRGMSP